jgi:hypothetical protein
MIAPCEVHVMLTYLIKPPIKYIACGVDPIADDKCNYAGQLPSTELGNSVIIGYSPRKVGEGLSVKRN